MVEKGPFGNDSSFLELFAQKLENFPVALKVAMALLSPEENLILQEVDRRMKALEQQWGDNAPNRVIDKTINQIPGGEEVLNKLFSFTDQILDQMSQRRVN